MERKGKAELDLSDDILKTHDERSGNAPERQIWQAHVEMEEDKRTHGDDELYPNVHHWAEEYARRAMRGVDATENEFQRAEERGEKHGIGEAPEEIASANDLSGG
jgi:hypothetical protein